jgi:predicted metal-dependent phosphoesterase TrpH
MNRYKADLHIHTVLSPCGDLEMSPSNIIRAAKSKQLDLIGITDHNTTRQCAVIMELGQREGIYVLCGTEVTTKEEAHCLAFFETNESLEAFQVYLDAN